MNWLKKIQRELTIDGFRALAHIQEGHGELISRNGNSFRGFLDLASWIAKHLRVENAVLDVEIALTGTADILRSSFSAPEVRLHRVRPAIPEC